MGSHHAVRDATSGSDVKGETRTSAEPRPRRAISAATAVPSEVPQSVTRSGPMPRRAASSSAASASRYTPRSEGGSLAADAP